MHISDSELKALKPWTAKKLEAMSVHFSVRISKGTDFDTAPMQIPTSSPTTFLR